MDKLPRVIHPLQPRALRESWSAPVAIDVLERVGALCAEQASQRVVSAAVEVALVTRGDLDVDLGVELDALGLVHLRMLIRGEITVTCQRCLEAMAWPIEIDADVLVIAPGETPGREDLDYLEVDDKGTLDVFAAIDEEVMLALPTVFRHSSCEPPAPSVARIGMA